MAKRPTTTELIEAKSKAIDYRLQDKFTLLTPEEQEAILHLIDEGEGMVTPKGACKTLGISFSRYVDTIMSGVPHTLAFAKRMQSLRVVHEESLTDSIVSQLQKRLVASEVQGVPIDLEDLERIVKIRNAVNPERYSLRRVRLEGPEEKTSKLSPSVTEVQSGDSRRNLVQSSNPFPELGPLAPPPSNLDLAGDAEDDG